MKVVLSPEALDDLTEIATWIARDNPERARSFSSELRAKCKDLGVGPERFPVVRDCVAGEIRKRSYRRYLIFYRIVRPRVEVLRIIQGSRDWAAFFEE